MWENNIHGPAAPRMSEFVLPHAYATLGSDWGEQQRQHQPKEKQQPQRVEGQQQQQPEHPSSSPLHAAIDVRALAASVAAALIKAGAV